MNFKVSGQVYCDFLRRFFNKEYPYLRLGQAFIAHHAPAGYTNAELFYEEDMRRAKREIEDNLVDWERKDG